MTTEPADPAGSAGSGVHRAFRTLVDGPVRRIFTTRAGGVSRPPYDLLNLGGHVGDDPAAVAANRGRLAGAAGLPVERLVWMGQVHGTRVTRVDSPGRVGGGGAGDDEVADSDGLVTAEPDLALAVLVADCIPLLAADPVAGVIAAVHAGRRGAAGGIAVRALEGMRAAGARTGRIRVWLGPAICGSCYEVPAGLRDDVEAALPGSACLTSWGTPGVDLRAGVVRQLAAAGVAEVIVDPRCTATDPALFSHRRGAPTGRLAGLIWIPG